MEKGHRHRRSHEELMEVIRKIKKEEHKAKKVREEIHELQEKSVEDAD